MASKCPKCRTENADSSLFCSGCGTRLEAAKEFSLFQTETLESSPPELNTGTIFAGRYQIIEELGKGGMGRVYRALDKKLNEEMALKLIRPEVAPDEKTIERFSNELKLARKIGHRNVGRMYELLEEKGTHFITMEYVAGEDLKSFIRRSRQIVAGTAVSIAKQICEGLAEAHRLGVIHRDLKPGNIMIDREGNAKIMDFGIARSLSADPITGAGVMIGTPQYMSPEQVEGKAVDERSDIYSFGIILYEMLTGQVPFDGGTPFSIGIKQKSERPRNPGEFNPQIPEELSRLILKCLEKEKEKRFQRVEEVLAALLKIKSRALPAGATSAKVADVEKTSETEWKKSIAVLPFSDLSPQKDQEYFCDGMAEELINVFSRIKGLKVVARTSAFSFKGKNVDVREIGLELGVDKVLEGSVRKAGNRLRISVQLIGAGDGFQLWSEKFDRELADVFAIQDEVTSAIVENLKVQLFGQEKAGLFKRSTEDPEAYNLALKGRHFLNKRTEEDLRRSIVYFDKMVERDPASSLGYAGLADAYNSLGYFNFLPAQEASAKARAAAEKALAIDGGLADAHASLGRAKLFFEWNSEGAEKDLRRAIECNPGCVIAHHTLAFTLSALGRHDEARAVIQQAQILDPLSPAINAATGWVLYLAREYERAIEQSEKTLEIDQNHHVAYTIKGLSLMEKGRSNEAIAAFQKALALEPSDLAPLGYLGVCYGRAGRNEECLRLLQEMDDLYQRKYVPPLYKALLLLGLGRKHQALEWLEKAFEARIPWMIFLRVWPIFDPLRKEPRFAEVIQKLESQTQ